MEPYAFFRGEYMPLKDAKIGILTQALHYGTATFGGVRANWDEESQQFCLFRIKDHYRRQLNACKILNISLPWDEQQMADITVETVRRSGYRQNVYCRPLAYKASEAIGVKLHDLEDDFCIFAVPFGRYIEKEEGARVAVSSWRRIDDNAAPARCKITGVYINSALSKTEVMERGFDEAIVLTHDGHVSEGSAENIFIVRDGELITPAASENILEGITRKTIMELAKAELGLETVERQIDRSELYISDEVFFCGTGVQVAAVVEIDGRPVGDGKIGPIVEKIRNLYFDVAKGKVKKYKQWCTPVY